MNDPCASLHAFFDGQLAPAEAARTREHLKTCARCQRDLDELVQLAAVVAQIPEDRAARYAAEVTSLGAARRRRSRWAGAVSLLAAAAALVVLLPQRCRGPRSTGDTMLLALMDRTPSWPIEARVARPELDRFRPRAVSLAGAAPGPLPLRELAALQEAGDTAGTASLLLLAGATDQAAPLLERLGHTPDADSDRAVAALQRLRPEEAFGQVESALAQSPTHPQALWNRALVLRDLQLELMSAAAFERVAALGEPGWSAEARERAGRMRAEVDARRKAWLAFKRRGEALIDRGEPISRAEIAGRPGLARHFFYHAVRGAPSRERAMALVPMAHQLDTLAGRPAASGGVLERYVLRIASADFRVRAPLAATYRGLLSDAITLPPPDFERYLDELRRAGQTDILIGALPWSGASVEHLTELERLAAGDPWLEAVYAYEKALDDHRYGRFADEEWLLLSALDRCRAEGMEYRCGYLERRLAESYYHLNRNSEAQRHAQSGWTHARATGEWGQEIVFLQELASLAEERRDGALARAYVGEVELQQVDSCEVRRYAALELARVSLDELRPDDARRQLVRAPKCDKPLDPAAIEALAVLAHWGGTPEESAMANEALVALRGPRPRRGEPAVVDVLEGRLLLETDHVRARALLERSLAATAKLEPWDPDRTEARPAAISLLILDAARRAAWGDAMAWFAREVGVDGAAARCALGLSVDYDRLVLAFADPGGRLEGRLVERLPSLPASGEVVSESVRARLAGCPVIDVFARPPYAGQPDLLPPGVPWRYRVGRGSDGAPPPAADRLVVTAPEPPAVLGLPSLVPWSAAVGGPPGATLHMLSGAQARPDSVLAAMASAGDVFFHAHGLVDLRVADASFLALSPDEQGRFALTAGEVRKRPLAGHPTVFLASCRAAQTSPGRYQAWSLPAAFVEAGARAVFASPALLADAEIRPFFEELAAAVRAGKSPAVALRDARVAAIARNPANSARHVLLFE